MDPQQQDQGFWGGLLHAFLSGAKDSALNLRDDLAQGGNAVFNNQGKIPDRLLSTLLSASTFPTGFLVNGDLNSPLMKGLQFLRPYGPNPLQQSQRTPLDDLLRALTQSPTQPMN